MEMMEAPGIFAAGQLKKKVVFCMPVNRGQKPHPKTIESLENTIPLLIERGWEEGFCNTSGNPYISGARAELTRKALSAGATDIFYLDYDLAWEPEGLLKVLEADGDVVCGTYRTKESDPSVVTYMGAIYSGPDERPLIREDGCIKARVVPAGFLRVKIRAIDMFMRAYPKLCYGPQYQLSVDLFNHGAHNRLWWGEDYAFARNYIAAGGEIWIVPDIQLDHWNHWIGTEPGAEVYRGNFHEFLMNQPGSSRDLEREEQHAGV